MGRRHRRRGHLPGLQLLRASHRSGRDRVRSQPCDAGDDVHGRRRFHADEPLRALRLPLQVHCRGRPDRGRHHRREPVGLAPVDRLADGGRYLHRLGERLQRDHDGRPQRWELAQRHRASAHQSKDTDHPVRVHLLLPAADRRRVRGDHGRHPRCPPRRPVRDRGAGDHGRRRRLAHLPAPR